MAWPKLRNSRSSGSPMTRRPTGGSHNGSANGGEQSHSADPVNGSADGRQLDDTSQLDGAQLDEGGQDEGGLDEGGLDSLSLLGLTPDPEPEAEPADPFPGEGTEGYRHDAPRPEHKPGVRAGEETGRGRPGIAAPRGNVAHLSANPRARLWQQRVIAAIIIMVVFSVLVSWQLGLTLAVIAIIADTIYRSRRGYSGQAKVRMNGAQRQTRRQLAKLGRAGYRAVHANLIPGSEDQIDHLVVGP